MKPYLTAALFSLLTIGCTADGLSPRQQADQRDLADARPVGDPVSCVSLSQVRETRVLDDQTIDFRLANGQVLRNRLPRACPGLAFEERFAYETSLGRLCAPEIITVLRSGGSPGPSCGLGQFQPVEIASQGRRR